MQYHLKVVVCLMSLFGFSVLNAVYPILKLIYDVFFEGYFVCTDGMSFLKVAVGPKLVAGMAEFGTRKLAASRLPPNFSEVGLVLGVLFPWLVVFSSGLS